MSKRRTHSPEFKARVAMEAISDRKTIQEITTDDAIQPIQVSQWKRQLLEGASELFTRSKKSKGTGESQAKGAELFQQIGRLQMELEGLKKVTAALTPVNCASWSITTNPNSALAAMRTFRPAQIDALLPAHIDAGIDTPDHGQDRLSLPGGSLQRRSPDYGLSGERGNPDQS